ncbi:hypothetical protein MNBD_GAMMA11-3270, partial [hydrothermal vent metagenome]
GKGGRLSLSVIDSGEGFDHEMPGLTEKSDYSGRGLKLISSLCTEMKIMGKGNVVMVYYDWGDQGS